MLLLWPCWSPRPRPEGSYKIRPVRSSFRRSFRLSVSFLRIGWLVFSKIQHGVKGSYIVVCDRVGFFWKNPHHAKMTKNGQKSPQNKVFGLFKKIMSLFLSGICVKRKFLWFINILQKLDALEKSDSQVIAQWDFSILYRPYFINRLISDFDFWHLERHEWKEQGLVDGGRWKWY